VQTYLLEIDQDQYTLLVSALERALAAGQVKVDPETAQDTLLATLQELPAIEKASPGIIHGLCY